MCALSGPRDGEHGGVVGGGGASATAANLSELGLVAKELHRSIPAMREG